MATLATSAAGMFFKETGSGEPLVLVHGGWTEHSTWQLTVPELAREQRVITYDRRGHGQSPPPERVLARRRHEDDLAALIETCAGGPAHVAGNSYGASVALGLAARRPELFRSLSAHEPTLLGIVAPNPDLQEAVEGLATAGRLLESGDLEAGARHFVENVIGPGEWAPLPAESRAAMVRNAPAFAAEQLDPDWARIGLEPLRRLQVPVLLTQGDASLPWFAPITRTLAGAIPGCRVVTIEGAGHVPHLTHPDEYAAIVRSFAMTARGTS